jgi:hypothetical protein
VSFADFQSEFPGLKEPLDRNAVDSSNCYGYRCGSHLEIPEDFDESDAWSDASDSVASLEDPGEYARECEDIYFALSELDPDYDVFSDHQGRNERYLVKGHIVGRLCEKAYVNHVDMLAIARAYSSFSTVVLENVGSLPDLVGAPEDLPNEILSIPEVPLQVGRMLAQSYADAQEDPNLVGRTDFEGGLDGSGVARGEIHPLDGFVVGINSSLRARVISYARTERNPGKVVGPHHLLLSRRTVAKVLLRTLQDPHRIWPGCHPSDRCAIRRNRDLSESCSDYSSYDVYPSLPPGTKLLRT